MSVALIEAAKSGDSVRVRQLIDQGAYLDTRDEEGLTAMHWAVRGDDSYVCLTLLHAGADPMARDEKGRTVLHHCAGYGAYRCARALVSLGGSRVDPDARDARGRTALHACAMTGMRTEVHTVLGRADLTIRDNEGFTALERAEQQGKELLAISLRAYAQWQSGKIGGSPIRRRSAPTGHRETEDRETAGKDSEEKARPEPEAVSGPSSAESFDSPPLPAEEPEEQTQLF